MSPQLHPFDIARQPDDTTCGPTCLHAIYAYYGEDVELAEIIASVPELDEGGTLGVLLATDALRRGYTVKIATFNLRVFDPTWFTGAAVDLRAKLLARADALRDDAKGAYVTEAYARFVELGGHIELRDIDADTLRRPLRRGVPILTGLSSTFLYREIRARGSKGSKIVIDDDIRGDPEGHFVVLTGYDSQTRQIEVSDPLHPNPLSATHKYRVGVWRVIGAIYLGVLTYDGILITIEAPHKKRPH